MTSPSAPPATAIPSSAWTKPWTRRTRGSATPSQVHQITREKVFEIEPAQAYPACVAFSGEQPVEYADEYDEDGYPDEGQPAGREPFSLAAVNAALAELAAPSD
jgi:hypothetical protein